MGGCPMRGPPAAGPARATDPVGEASMELLESASVRRRALHWSSPHRSPRLLPAPSPGSGSRQRQRNRWEGAPLERPPPRTPGPRAHASFLGPRPGAFMKILIVEDNKDVAEAMTLLLRPTRHEVAVAHDGRGALEICRWWSPDLLM